MRFGDFKNNDIIGFSEPNDLAGHLQRARLAKKFGLFAKIPMWGGVRLHQYYPPLSSIFINIFSLKISLLLAVIYAFSIFALYKNPLTGLFFIISYFFLSPLLYCGRFPEILGHLFIIHAFFSQKFYFSGLLLGLAGLTHPLSFLFGSLLLLLKFNFFIYLVAALICSWWMLPFFLRRKKVGYLAEREKYGTFLSVYWLSWATIFNNLIFIFFPLPLAGFFGVGCWFTSWFDNEMRIKKIKRKPVFLNQIPQLYPAVKKIKSAKIAILPKPERKVPPSSIWAGRWAISSFLLDRGIAIYNGLPETETPYSKIKIPKNIKICYI